MNTHLLTPMLALALAAPAAAQSLRPKLPELVQEFFLVETIYPQERHETQLTGAVALRDGTPWTALADFGITDRFQFTGEWSDPGGEDPGTAGLGVLYALLPYESPFALSVSASVGLASGQGPVWTPTVVAAKRFGALQLHASAATELAGDERDLSGGLGAMFDAGRFTPTFEWAIANEPYLVPGLFLHFPNAIEVGAGLPLRLEGDVNAALHLMFTIEF